ncbi:MAG: hypothetical protein EBY21_12175 [Alphaproteobacteria bacterium]|nr:hypothetical protein [Alphaproteobacteria bacterium]
MTFSISPQPLTIDPAAAERSAQEMSLSFLNGVNPSLYTDLIMSSGLFQGSAGDVSKLQADQKMKFTSLTHLTERAPEDGPLVDGQSDLVSSEAGGIESGVTTQAGDPIFLFTDPIHANVVLGRIGADAVQASSGDVAFALFLEDGEDRTPAGFWIVEYAAMFNSDPDLPNNPINALSVHAQVNAGERAAFSFDGVDWVVKAFIKIME